MLIRNALVDGVLTELRLKHGCVQEMGMGLAKGLYESELDLAGDALVPCPERVNRRLLQRATPAQLAHIMPGTPAPLRRIRSGLPDALIDEHSAD